MQRLPPTWQQVEQDAHKRRGHRRFLIAGVVALLLAHAATAQDPAATVTPEREAAGSDATPERDAETPSLSDTADSEPAPTPAEEPAKKPRAREVDVIVITADRVLATEFDAPVSVTSFDAADLVAMGVEDVADIAAITPNLEIRSTGSTSSTFFIRGVGLNDFTANAAGAIAIYQDDVALNLPAIQLVQLFDAREVEVLRGPQGTGPGRNASGGAIRVHSNKPTGEYQAFLRSELGNFGAKTFEGGLEVPIVEDILSTRVSFVSIERDPFVDNDCGSAPPRGVARVTGDLNRRLQPAICGETLREVIEPPGFPRADYSVSRLETDLPSHMNDTNNWAARAQLRLVPPETNMDWLLNVHGSDVDQLATVGQAIGTGGGFFGGTTGGYRQPEIDDEEQQIFAALGAFDVPAADRGPFRARARELLGKKLAERLDKRPYRGDYNRGGNEKQKTIGGFVRGDFEFDNAFVTSITSYDRYVRERDSDGDFTPNVIFENDQEDDAWQIYQSLEVEGDLADGTFVWNTGGYYLMDHLDFFADTITGPGLNDLGRVFEQESNGFGIYAGFAWDILDDFTLDAGARYNWEQKKFDVDLVRSGRSVCDVNDCKVSDSWSAPTGTISLRYRLQEDLSVFVKYARGWKGAQYNAGGASGAAITLADPETIDAWETGMSGSWFDDRFSLKASLFYYDYEDYQVFITQDDEGAPPQRVVINAKDAENYGAEIEAVTQPFDGLKLTARFGWLESKFLDFTREGFRVIPTPEPPPIIVPVTTDYTGNRLPNTPQYKLSLSAEYEFDMGNFGWLIPRYDYSWTDDVFFDPSDGRGATDDFGNTYLPEYAIGQKAFATQSARLAYRTPSQKIEIAIFVRNLTDEVYKTYAFDATVGADLVGNLVGDPRTWGVSARIEF